MKSIRYFYGTEYKIATVPVLLDSNNEVITTIGNPVGKKKSTPRVTICSIYDSDKSTLSFGVSRCSTKDIFNKKLGRKLVLERAENNPIDVMHIENYSQLGKICTQRCLELEDEALDWSFPIKF